MDTGLRKTGGEGGIRTLDTGVSPYNGLANRRLQPLGHLSGVFCRSVSLSEGSSLRFYVNEFADGKLARLAVVAQFPRKRAKRATSA